MFNPSPTVAAARRIAAEFHKEQVIILMIDDKGVMEMATYGKDTTLCKCADVLGNAAFDAVTERVRYLQMSDGEKP